MDTANGLGFIRRILVRGLFTGLMVGASAGALGLIQQEHGLVTASGTSALLSYLSDDGSQGDASDLESRQVALRP
jgi:hypothetical protein